MLSSCPTLCSSVMISGQPEVATQLEEASGFERILYKPVPLWSMLAGLLFMAALAVAYAAFLLHSVRGGTGVKWLREPALFVAEAPLLLWSLRDTTRNPFLSPANETSAAPVAFGARPPGLSRSAFVDPGFLLVPLYDPVLKRPLVRLIRLSDGSVLREYAPNLMPLQAEVERLSTPPTNVSGVPFWMGHPELLEDGSILFKGNNLLVRADACNRVLWTKFGFHHSIERAAENGFWTARVHPIPQLAGVGPAYRSEAVALVSDEGEILYSKTLDQIFKDNGLEALVRGRQYSDDPYHLNDVEPVLEDGPHWRRGDIFLSLAYQSMVMLFRPTEGRVIWWQIGPWTGQHDVNVLDTQRIAIFDNRVNFEAAGPAVRGNSRELVVDFGSGKVTSPWEAALRRLRFQAPSNGRGTVLPRGDLVVEESLGGEVMRLSAEGSVLWRFLNTDARGRGYRLFWSRYLEPALYSRGIAAASTIKCVGVGG